MPSEPKTKRAQDVDRYVGQRLRERRLALGLTQQGLAELIGVTYQQEHKYEKAINRISASRLYAIASKLGVDMNYFVQDIDTAKPRSYLETMAGRRMIELSALMRTIPAKQQAALLALARALVEPA